MTTRKEQEEKRAQRNKRLMGIFIIVIMVASTIGFFYGSQQQEETDTTYNNFQFKTNKERKWVTKINGQEFDFWYHPIDVELYDVPDEVLNLFRGKQAIIFTFLPNASDVQFVDAARFEMTNNLAKRNVYVSSGILEESDVYKLPIIDCNNATEQVPVLKVVNSEEASFVVEGNCAILSDMEIGTLKKIVNLEYRLLGVIE